MVGTTKPDKARLTRLMRRGPTEQRDTHTCASMCSARLKYTMKAS